MTERVVSRPVVMAGPRRGLISTDRDGRSSIADLRLDPMAVASARHTVKTVLLSALLPAVGR